MCKPYSHEFILIVIIIELKGKDGIRLKQNRIFSSSRVFFRLHHHLLRRFAHLWVIIDVNSEPSIFWTLFPLFTWLVCSFPHCSFPYFLPSRAMCSPWNHGAFYSQSFFLSPFTSIGRQVISFSLFLEEKILKRRAKTSEESSLISFRQRILMKQTER